MYVEVFLLRVFRTLPSGGFLCSTGSLWHHLLWCHSGLTLFMHCKSAGAKVSVLFILEDLLVLQRFPAGLLSCALLYSQSDSGSKMYGRTWGVEVIYRKCWKPHTDNVGSNIVCDWLVTGIWHFCSSPTLQELSKSKKKKSIVHPNLLIFRKSLSWFSASVIQK